MRNRLSLKTAMIIPIISMLIIMASAVIYLWYSNYQFLAVQHGYRVISALSELTNEKINSFIGEPHRLSAIYASSIAEFETSDPNAIERNKDFTLNFLKAQKLHLPQISVASYGDEQKRYMGYRLNDDGTYSLMRQDETTAFKLNIYAGEDEKTDQIASYEGYNPGERPWYKPVKNNPVIQWSPIYINVDEKNESTISTIAPIIDKVGVFKGVAELDVKLNGINQFLANDKTKGTGLIYIVDRDWKLVAQSGKSQTLKAREGDPSSAEPLLAIESEDIVISDSAKHLRKSMNHFDDVVRVKLGDQSYYLLGKEVDARLNLGWKIIAAIPEADIMDTVKNNLILSIFVMFTVMIVGTIGSLLMIGRFANPIISVAKAAVDISEGHLGNDIPLSKHSLFETHELITAFNRMSSQIKSNLEQLDVMHHREKSLLEAAIAERTTELERTMKELVDREKLASLGSLVSGISHEVNTPLGVSVTAASFMEEANAHVKALLVNNQMTKQDLLKYIDNMEESTAILNTNLTRAASLIKSFKEIAVSQSSEVLEYFDFEAYIGMVITSLKHEYKHTNHTFTVACRESITINSYPGVWSQIFTNLIMNALTHAFINQKEGIISIVVIESDNSLIVEFSDNGSGIDEVHRDHVFDPFYTTSRGTGGSGLGLNIIYNLVTGILRGSITLETEKGIGTKFVITVPKM